MWTRRFAGLLMAAVTVTLGPGCVPGTTGGDPTKGDGEVGTFMVNPPRDVLITAGETESFTVEIDRGEMFDEEVHLEMEIVGEDGLEFTNPDAAIPADEESVEVEVTARADAKPGSRTVRITARPARGQPAEPVELEVTVVGRDE